jgi:hypothetical protein
MEELESSRITTPLVSVAELNINPSNSLAQTIEGAA